MLRYRIREGSGGAGLARGGDGIERDRPRMARPRSSLSGAGHSRGVSWAASQARWGELAAARWRRVQSRAAARQVQCAPTRLTSDSDADARRWRLGRSGIVVNGLAQTLPMGIRGGSLGPAWRRLGTCSALSRGSAYPATCSNTSPPCVSSRVSDFAEEVLPVGHRIAEAGRLYLRLTAGGGRAEGRARCEDCGYQEWLS